MINELIYYNIISPGWWEIMTGLARLLSCYLPLQSPWSVTLADGTQYLMYKYISKTKFTHLVKRCQISPTKFQIQ